MKKGQVIQFGLRATEAHSSTSLHSKSHNTEIKRTHNV